MSNEQRVSKAVWLDSLPASVLTLIFQECSSATRRSLLQVSRLTRDTVLGDARSAGLKLTSLDTPATCKPLARLLKRVCSAGSQRLALILDGKKVRKESAQHQLLSSLLHHGIIKRGWQSVKEVTVKGFKCSTPLLLVASAFPALEKLAVVSMPLTYMDLEHLSVCTQLTSLELDSCNLTAEIASSKGTSTSPLAAVSSIRQLKLNEVSSAIACGLTQLTSLALILEAREETEADCIKCTTGMNNLQQLQVVTSRGWDSMPLLQQLVTTSAQLRVLELPCCLGQQEMDLLLTRAPQLTHLTCDKLEVTEDRSQSACSWAELITDLGDSYELAYLPLRNIQRLVWDELLELPSPCPCVRFYLHEGQQDERSRIRDAVTNLGRCPAWQQSGQAVKFELNDAEADFIDSQSVVEAAAALSGLTNKQLQLSINHINPDASVMEQLGRALGSSLTHLEIRGSDVSRDLWPAVWAHLPGLQQLSLFYWTVGDVFTIHFEDLAAFCTHATRPLKLCLDERVEEGVGSADRLHELGSIWGGPQVTVSFCKYDE